MQTFKVILTGATVLVGEGVLLECLASAVVSKVLFPNHVLTLQQVGAAMIHSVTRGSTKQVLEARDMRQLAAP